MDVISLLVSIAGLALSVYAIKTAAHAKLAINKTLQRAGIQKDIPEIKKLLELLSKAKSIADLWAYEMPQNGTTGRKLNDDLRVIREAKDALAEWVPSEASSFPKGELAPALEGFTSYYDQIAAPEINDKPWKGMLSDMQTIIRILKEYIRDMEKSQLLSSD